MTVQHVDVLVIGAGISGIGAAYHLQVESPNRTYLILEGRSDIGGTWTWNRYPGAASDSECYYYCLTFSKELLQEWKWSVRYPSWDENLRYMHQCGVYGVNPQFCGGPWVDLLAWLYLKLAWNPDQDAYQFDFPISFDAWNVLKVFGSLKT